MSTDLYLNEHTGELTCVEHGGGSLRAAVTASSDPHHTPLWSPFGTWYYVDAMTKRAFIEQGMAPECETCKWRKSA